MESRQGDTKVVMSEEGGVGEGVSPASDFTLQGLVDIPSDELDTSVLVCGDFDVDFSSRSTSSSIPGFKNVRIAHRRKIINVFKLRKQLFNFSTFCVACD